MLTHDLYLRVLRPLKVLVCVPILFRINQVTQVSRYAGVVCISYQGSLKGGEKAIYVKYKREEQK